MICWTDLLNKNPPNELRYSIFNGEPSPRMVVWNITSHCNLLCRHCYFGATKTSDSFELSQKDAEAFIEDLAKFRVEVLLFSGGEPLLRKDIFELAKFANDQGIRAVLSTNGTLITREVAKKIKEAGFSYVGISFDGGEDTNDRFRQKRGAFSSALSGLRYCQDLGLKTGLRFTITKFNLRDLSFIFNLVEQESIPRICLYHLVYTGRGKDLVNQDLNDKERREVLEIVWQKTLEFSKKGLNTEVLTVDNHADGVWIYLKLKKTNPQAAQRAWELLKLQGGNNSGIRIGAVDNLGNIYADQFLRTHPLGNIRKQSFSQVWQDNGNELLSALRNRKSFLKGRCPNCNFLNICNGNFRARAEAVFNDIWAEDPACYLTDEEISSL